MDAYKRCKELKQEGRTGEQAEAILKDEGYSTMDILLAMATFYARDKS